MNRRQLMESNANSMMRRQASIPDAPPTESEEAAPNIFPSIWRHRWIVLSITVIFVIGAVVFLRVVPPSFTATAELTIDPPPIVPQLGISVPSEGGDGFLWTQIAIMQSPAVCMDAAKALRPYATQEELHVFTNELRNVTGDVGKKDSIISLTYTDKSADDASSIVNAIVQSYANYVSTAKGYTSHELIDVLNAEKKKYDDQLTAQRDAEIDFRKQHPDLQNVGANGANVITNELAQLFDAKTKAVLKESDITAAYNTAQQLREDLPKLEQYAQSQAFRSPTSDEIASTRKAISDTEMQLSLLRGNYPDKNPFVVRDTVLLAEFNAKLQILAKHFGDEFMESLELAKVNSEEEVKALDEQIKISQGNAAHINDDAGDLMKLQNLEAGTVKVVDALGQQIKTQQLQNVVSNIPTIRILASAVGSDATRSPEPSRVLALTLAVGLAIGVGFSLVRDKLDHRVRSPEEIAGLLGLPVIGIVPHMKRGLTPLARAQAVHWDPMSEVAESYRAVRTAVHFGVPAGQARTIVVTSPTPGDGKSTLASNLAISMAQAGKRTLLLDADFRRPVQHRMFELKDESGLTAVLAGQEPLSKAIRRTVVEGLDLLPAGPLPLNPSELLNGDSFASILEELTQKYDHIILDCPPVIAVTDARILGAVCDLSLLVLRAGKTTRQGAEMARTGLLSVGSRLLGVVVNDVARGEEQYGYYGSYAYRGDSGHGPKRLAGENGGSHNGHSSGSHRRLPSPSDVDSMQ
jgi:capsular exopolysaccharide synthesis family protein